LRRIPMGTAKCKNSIISYYVIAEELEQGIETYGALIEYDGESAIVRNVTLSQRRVTDLLTSLRRGCVTPSTLPDIVYDWILR